MQKKRVVEEGAPWLVNKTRLRGHWLSFEPRAFTLCVILHKQHFIDLAYILPLWTSNYILDPRAHQPSSAQSLSFRSVHTISMPAFLDLPLEIRIQIYHHLRNTLIILESPTLKICKDPSPILQANKKIHREAKTVLDGANRYQVTFRIAPSDTSSWRRSLKICVAALRNYAMSTRTKSRPAPSLNIIFEGSGRLRHICSFRDHSIFRGREGLVHPTLQDSWRLGFDWVVATEWRFEMPGGSPPEKVAALAQMGYRHGMDVSGRMAKRYLMRYLGMAA